MKTFSGSTMNDTAVTEAAPAGQTEGPKTDIPNNVTLKTMNSKITSWECETCGNELTVYVSLCEEPLCTGVDSKHAARQMSQKVKKKSNR